MKILITGANGQVGSALCRLGKFQPYTLIATDSKSLDITNHLAVSNTLTTYSPDVIVNAAAYTAVDRAETECDKANAVNGFAVGHLAERAVSLGIPLIHLSTDYVFDGTKQGAYVEEDATNPVNVYGQSKLLGEQMFQASGCKGIILRTSWVFGLEGSNFPKTMLRLARERTEFGVVNDQQGCPTFADHIAGAILAIVSRYKISSDLPWGLYHYSGDSVCTWFQFANQVISEARRAGILAREPCVKPLGTQEYPTPARRPTNSVLSCQKFTANFSGILLSDWRAGLVSLVSNSKTSA